MIIVTGAAGFIGSCLIQKLNDEGHKNLILVDNFSNSQKNKNFEGKDFEKQIDRNEFINWLDINYDKVKVIFHIGARTDTTEMNYEILNELNLDYTKAVWTRCAEFNIPLIYASSAATYGLGEFGYDDDESKLSLLQPLNPYGDSKNEFDKWAIVQEKKPIFWAGLKFFNVYGPNEYHKSRMASVIFHTYNQIQASGKMKLFQSHKEGIKDGEQMRDFVYVKDVVEVLYFLMIHQKDSGIYNLGSGKARTFLDLVINTFNSLEKQPDISFVPTPEDIRDKYQYFTEANMNKLYSIGYNRPFHTLEEGVKDYVQNYLSKGAYY
ncbi:ADP-glyceromanno-heptose 6-epimerase precursor [Mucilaginibacter gracilis]|uniref:ADP-L-glycero-D-manno-heptose-6-epimerase n=1 Tax=Mucilaginibacter gracilis TaxID=423350 RepID=A0A495J2M4_9SPHI|nr:ADP-glyceromanno-heptose 6-epimerase [Mucilaginibacter gracilis]RKR82259.1 ADP-glyceromanno-heptose 6-epimerase precursor [Mucilaginibacter gracilis]